MARAKKSAADAPEAGDGGSTTAVLDPPTTDTNAAALETTTEAPTMTIVKVAGLRIEAADGGPLVVQPDDSTVAPSPFQVGDMTVIEAADMCPAERVDMFPPMPDGASNKAGQSIDYFFDNGKVRGAYVSMWKGDPTSADVQTYRAVIRMENGLFYWMEPDSDYSDGWRRVKRGQSLTNLTAIVEQAIEYAIGRVFGSWVT